MITLTLQNGQKISISADQVIRVRATRQPEASSDNAKTRLDWIRPEYVQEEPETVAELILGAKSKPEEWVSLDTPRMGEVWFLGSKSAGPLFLTDKWKTDGIQSVLKIGNLTQYVSNSPEEVSDIIKNSGGVWTELDPPESLDIA